MHWKVELKNKPRKAMTFCKKHLKNFEVKDLKYIRFRPCKDGFIIYGHCVCWPEEYCYLSCCIPGPCPGEIQLAYGGKFILNTLDEGFVWIYGHEIYHYLARTKQLKGKDNEVNADRYAKKLYDKFVK